MLFSVKELVGPHLEKLKRSKLDRMQKAHVDIIESNLNEIVSSFVPSHSTKLLKLTPSEIQVANLVKQGKITKKISS